MTKKTSNESKKHRRRTATVPIADQDYLELIKRFPLMPIKNPESNSRAIEVLHDLMDKNSLSGLTPSEDAYYSVLDQLVDTYEQKKYPPKTRMAPRDLLRSLMEEQGLTQQDLVVEFGAQSRVSDFLNGKRDLSMNQVKKLSKRFAMKPDAFM